MANDINKPMMTVSGDNEQKPLTKHDEAILQVVFSPEFSLLDAELAMQNDEQCSAIEIIPCCFLFCNSLSLPAIKGKELAGIRLGDEGKNEEALKIFNDIIDEYPHYASAYLNRSQVQPSPSLALTDLDTVIALCLSSFPSDVPFPSSHSITPILAQSYAARAALKKKSGQCPQGDWEAAAKLGHPDARIMAKRNNPYAAMCHSVMNQVFAKYFEDAGLRKGQHFEPISHDESSISN